MPSLVSFILIFLIERTGRSIVNSIEQKPQSDVSHFQPFISYLFKINCLSKTDKNKLIINGNFIMINQVRSVRFSFEDLLIDEFLIRLSFEGKEAFVDNVLAISGFQVLQISELKMD